MDEEHVARINARVSAGDAFAMYILGGHYREGVKGVPQNFAKAIEMWQRSAKLGCAGAHSNLGIFYKESGNMKKAKYHVEMACLGGDLSARHNLAAWEWQYGDKCRAIKHWTIGAKYGGDHCLSMLETCFLEGDITKDEYEEASRSHKESKDEMRSEQRTEAQMIKERARSRQPSG